MFCASTFSTLPEASLPANALGVGREHGKVAVPSGGQFAALHLVDLGGEFRVLAPVGPEEFRPPAAGLRPPGPHSGREMLLDALGDKELRILGPAIEALAEADLLFAQGLAMGCGSVLLVRGTIADVAIQDNECGAALRLSEDLKGVLDAVDVVGVADAQDVPPITQETGPRCLQ